MPASFTSVSSIGVGTSLRTIYTATENSVLIGCNIANSTNQIAVVSLILHDSVEEEDVFIKKNFSIGAGFNDEVMKGNKIVLKVGDQIKAIAASASSADIILSLLTGI